MKISELIIDFSLYPREKLNQDNVDRILLALESGLMPSNFPKIIIDKKSRKIVDGFHRKTAFEQFFGPDCEIETIEKNYSSDKDFYLDAVRYNSIHGKNLDFNFTIKKAIDLKISSILISNSLNITKAYTDKIVSAHKSIVVKHSSNLLLNHSNESVKKKKNNRYKYSKTENDYRYNESIAKLMEKISQERLLQEVADLIELGCLDMNNKKIIIQLERLQELLNKIVK
jgi:hypothetical protein